MTIEQLAQQASTDEFVVLFSLDATAVGGDVYYFTSSSYEQNTIVWQGNTYLPIPLDASGFEWNGQGALPQPTLRVANINGVFAGLVNEFDDLCGLPVTRTRTFRRYLDGESEADPDAHWPIDYYVVQQKTAQNAIYIEFKLSAKFDQQGVTLPRRAVLQNSCTHIYRRWNGTSFDYTKATCPYAGTTYFTSADAATNDPSQDRCAKRLGSCKLRFGNDPLPTRAFPGVSRVSGG